MKDVSDLRAENFQIAFEMFKEMVRKDDPGVREHGMLRKYAAFLEANEAFLSHLNTGKKPVGANSARNIEQKLGLPHGWMDQDHSTKTTVVEPTNPAEAKYMELALEQFKADPVGAMGALMTFMSERQKRAA